MLSGAKIVSVFPYSVRPYVLKRDYSPYKESFFKSIVEQTNSQLTAVCDGVSEIAMSQEFEICNLLEASCLIFICLVVVFDRTAV